MTDKDKIIRQVYYDKDDGFGSISDTYKQANKILNSITVNDVKEFLAKQKGRQTKSYKGFNSYVANDVLEEIQIDLADFTKSAEVNNGFRYAFVAIDIFSKIIHSTAIKDKTPSECVRALKEVLNKIGVPKQLYHDNEGSFNSIVFIRLCNENKIQQIVTSTPTQFAERAIHTMKNMIHTRLDGLEMSTEKWVEMLPAVLNKYNNTEHSTTGVKPNDAKKDENKVEVWLNIKNKAVYNRTYPPLQILDKVRTYIKPKTFKKGYESTWSKEVYTIQLIKDGTYLLNNYEKKRVYHRHELLKVEGEEGKDG